MRSTILSILLLICLTLLCAEWAACASPLPVVTADASYSHNPTPDAPATHEVKVLAVALLQRNSTVSRLSHLVPVPLPSHGCNFLPPPAGLKNRGQSPFSVVSRPPPNEFSLPLLI